jgi:GNAT superfamily N-acetyltransferase
LAGTTSSRSGLPAADVWPDAARTVDADATVGRVEIRPARVDDAAQIAEIHVRSWQEGYRGLIPQDYLDGLDPAARVDSRRRSLQEADLPRSGTLVAADDGRVVGFAHLGPARDEGAGAAAGEVWAIYLSPDVWGKGYGRELMSVALGQLAQAGYQQATLWVLDSNARARQFYEAAGFHADGAAKVDESRGFPLTEIRYRRSLP